MKKMKTKGKRLFSLALALALALTSVSIPSQTAEAAKTVKVKKIQITKPKKKSVTIKKGKSLQLKIKVTPKNANNKKVKYKTSNRKIARVTSKGKIKAIKNGNAKITITAKDGSRKKAVLKVKVVTPVSKVKLSASTRTLTVGQSVTLKAAVSPASASKKTMKWTTSNKNVATVTSKGVVKGVGAGTAVITATAADGSKKKASCKVTVKAAAQTPDTPNPPENPDTPNPPEDPDHPKPPEGPDDPKPPVTAVTLEKIEVTKQPGQTGYWVGETFNPSGMEVTAVYSDKKEKVLDTAAYTITPSTDTPLTLQDREVVISYEEGGITKTASVEIMVTEEPAVSLSSIEITKQPDKTDYREGERFDPSGMEVTAVYSDGSRKTVEEDACSFEPDRALTFDDKEVTVTYQEFGRPKTAVLPITVAERPKVALKSIEITKQPNKTEYWEGETFDSDGMRITAVYADGTEMGIGGDVCSIEPDRPLTVSDREVTVTYKDGDVSLSQKISITVRKLVLKKIEVTTMPSKTTYDEGDVFDKTGMVVTATYANGDTKIITGYTCSEGPLDPADQVIEIAYTENGITKKTAIDIVVAAKIKLTGITCELKNTEPEIEGTVFREQDIAVTAHFEDGTSKAVSISKCEVSPSAFTLETTSATVYYTYGTRRKSCKVTGFTVKPYRERYTFEDKDTVGTIVKHNGTGENLPVEADMAEVNLDFAEGLSGNALKMDGTYGIRLDKIAGTESQSYSISMWVKPDAKFKENVALLISTANGFGLGTNTQNWCALAGRNAEGGLKFWSRGTSGLDLYTAAEGSIPIGENAEWSHIALVVDGTMTAEGTPPAEGSKKALGTLYINGRKAGSGNVQNEKGPDMKTYLGVTGWEWDGYFSGMVDELVFTNEVFTPEDVEGYYLEQYADKLSKITEVTASTEADIEIEYGTSLADVKRVLAEKVTLSGTDGSKQFSFENTADIWTLENYTVTAKGEITAKAKVEAPVGYAFTLENGKVSIWKQAAVKITVKNPEMITQVTPSENQIEVLYGTTEAQIKEKLAALIFEVTTEHGSQYSIKNGGSLWSLTETETGYTATATLPRADAGFEYAEGKSKVTVQITVKQPGIITGLSADKTEISVPYNSTAGYVQGELAKLKITAAVSSGAAPVLANKAELWTIAEYNPEAAGEYTATAKITAPLGYKFAEETENVDIITVKVKVAEKSDQKKLVSIDISTQPDRTRYIQGHTFDKTGMVVEAVYANGTRENVTENVVIADETKPLELTDTFVKISYTEADETEASGEITVNQDCSISVVELKDGASVYYSFDETLADRQTEGRTAKLVDNRSLAVNANLEPVYADGVKGHGILLNGTDKETALELLASVPSGKKDFTINMWVQPKSLDKQWAMILSCGNVKDSKELVFYANPSTGAVNTLNVQNGADPDANFNDLLFKDQWIMLTCANSKDKMEVYANGKKIGDAPSVKNGITRSFLGGGWWDPFHGVFDEFSMYDCTLTREEVAELYHHVPWNIEKIEYEEELTVTKKNASEAAVKAELARLPLHAVMRNGETPSLTSDENWALTGTQAEGYTAVKELQLPQGYAMPDGAKKVVLTVKVGIRSGELTGLEVTPPTKLNYLEGEILDKTGMAVRAVYTEEGAEPTYKDVTKLVTLSENGKPFEANEPLTKGTHTVTVTYTEGSDKQEKEITIVVQSIEEALNEARLTQYSFEDNLNNGVAGKDSAKMVANGGLTDWSGTPEYCEGIKDRGILLNSTSTKTAIELAQTMEAGKDFTINFWVQPKSLKEEYAMILYSKGADSGTKEKELVLYADPKKVSNSISIQTGTGGEVILENQLFENRWTMLTWVNAQDEMKLYVDGKEAGIGVVAKEGLTRLFLGGGKWTAFHGIFDEVSIYNRTLQDKEVEYLYNLVPSIISEVSVSQKELMFLLDDVKSNTNKIKEALSKLDISVAMKHGEKCEFKNDAVWNVPEINGAGSYTATKTLTLPEGYVLNGSESARTVTLSVTLAVKDAALNDLEIAVQPNKRAYLVGETFDPAGMVVKAKYTGNSGASEQDVTDKITIADAEKALTAADNKVTVSYEEGGITKTVQVDINVYTADQPESIYAARTAYYTFDDTLDNAQTASEPAKVVKKENPNAEGNLIPSDTAVQYEKGINGNGVWLNRPNTPTILELGGAIPSGKKDFTINMWVQPKEVIDAYTVMLFGGDTAANIGLALYGSRGGAKLGTVYGVSGAKDTVTGFDNQIAAGKWFMYTWSSSGNKMEFYVNGTKVGEGPSVEKAVTRLFLGGSWWGDYFQGVYDEVSIFNRSLTAAEVDYLHGTVPWTIDSISVSENELAFGNTATEADVKKKLSELAISASMKNGNAPQFKNDSNWVLTPEFKGAGAYKATKELTLTGPYVMSDNAKTYTVSVDVKVKDASVSEIAIVNLPGKHEFVVGDVFDGKVFQNSGMVIQAKYTNGETKDVSKEVTFSKAGEPLAETDQNITVTYTEGNDTFTKEIPIKVYRADQPESMYASRTAYYTFDGAGEERLKNEMTGGSAVEEGLGGKTVNGLSYEETGVSGKAFKIGSSDSIGLRLEDGAISKANYTISMWVKAKELPATKYACTIYSPSTTGKELFWYGPFGDANKFAVRTEVGGRLEFVMDSVLELERWRMLTLVVEAGKPSFYVNDQKIDTGNATLGEVYNGINDAKMYLGIGPYNWDPTFVGSYDEISLFNDKALTADQVKCLYDKFASSANAG